MKKIQLLLLGCIFLLGVFFRFYELGTIPSSLNWDEVSWGYNAYSIATTWRDEYGNFLPLSFRAFGDFKQPMYVYLDAVPTLLLGLTSFAVRFPSALIGSLTILSVFFLVRQLFFKERIKDILALVTAGLFAISPWSIQFSRVAFEANVGVFFTITGAALFLWGLNSKKQWGMIVGGIIMSLSCYTYHSQKLFTPLLFMGFIIYARDYFFLHKKKLLIILLTFFVANIFWVVDSRTTARGRSVMFTSQQTQLLAEPTKKLISDREGGSIFGQLLHNRRYVYANIYINNYLMHFDPNYLFLKGDNPRHHPPGMGILYLVSLPFIIIGMVVLFKKYQQVALLLFGWFLLAPVASALTVDTPNASRSMVFLPTWQIFAAIGIITTIYALKKQKQLLIACLITGMYLVNMIYYAHWYFGHTDSEYARDWQYGYREAVQFVSDAKNKDTHTYFTQSVEQAYIFYLFHNAIEPKVYLSTGGSERIKKQCFSINNAYFVQCEKIVSPKSGDMLVSAADEKDPRIVKIKEIHYPSDDIALRIYQYK